MNGGAVSIVYDGFGNRVAKTVGGVTTSYLVEDDVNPTGYPQVFDELTGSTVTRTYTYGLQRIDEEQVISSTWTPSFYGYDGFGNVRQLTNTAGAVTDTYEYDAFGHTFATSCTTPNNYLYRGEQYDADLNLYYLRARYYKPVTGRFFSRDPADEKLIDPETLHRYLYAAGDPINRLDPRGREDFADYLMEVKRVLVARPTVAIGVAAAIGCLIPAVGYLVTGHDIFPDPEAERGDTAICVGVAIFAILQGVAALF